MFVKYRDLIIKYNHKNLAKTKSRNKLSQNSFNDFSKNYLFLFKLYVHWSYRNDKSWIDFEEN